MFSYKEFIHCAEERQMSETTLNALRPFTQTPNYIIKAATVQVHWLLESEWIYKIQSVTQKISEETYIWKVWFKDKGIDTQMKSHVIKN